MTGPVKEGYYRMFRPIRSKQGPFYLVGGLVGGKKGPAYTKRVAEYKDVPKVFSQICQQIEKDFGGIKMESPTFTGRIRS